MKNIKYLSIQILTYCFFVFIFFIAERKLICPILEANKCNFYIPDYFLIGAIVGLIILIVYHKKNNHFHYKTFINFSFALVTFLFFLVLIVVNVLNMSRDFQIIIVFWTVMLYGVFFLWFTSKDKKNK